MASGQPLGEEGEGLQDGAGAEEGNAQFVTDPEKILKNIRQFRVEAPLAATTAGPCWAGRKVLAWVLVEGLAADGAVAPSGSSSWFAPSAIHPPFPPNRPLASCFRILLSCCTNPVLSLEPSSTYVQLKLSLHNGARRSEAAQPAVVILHTAALRPAIFIYLTPDCS
jgi:hypothetical protein